MRNILVVSILILAFCVVSFAQTNQNAPCPTIDITGPASVVFPGEIGQFTASLDVENPKDYVYVWEVTGGKIVEEKGEEKTVRGKRIEEKGKTFIKFIASSEVGDESITATVTIAGLPIDCPDSASLSMVVSIDYVTALVNEFSIPVNQIAKSKLNNLATEVQKNPSAQIYIIERFEKKTLPKTIKRKNQKMIDYLKEAGMGVSRFTFINGYSDKNLTQIYIVPSGATPPVCDDCEEIQAT